jgi:hypothetical protein
MKHLTPAEVRILRFYKSIAKPDKARGVGRYFIRSLKTIAAATDCTPKTVTRANTHFGNLGILIWAPGNGGDWKTGLKGQPNQYSLEMHGWRGYDTVLGVRPAMLASVRRQVAISNRQVRVARVGLGPIPMAPANSEPSNYRISESSNQPIDELTNYERL